MRFTPSFSSRRSAFGDLVVIAFLLAQALDGMLTYLGVRQFGPAIEANPLIASALPVLGVTATVTAAKLVAAGFGILLHLRGVHRVVAVLTALYLAGAVAPWTAILFLY